MPAPSALSAVADGTVVSLSWVDESSGSAGAVIQRSPNGSTGWAQIGAYAAGVLAAEDVVSAGTYYYRALGIFRGLTSETPSSTADVTVVAPVPAPASFLATVDSYDITLSWVDESGGTAQHVIQNSADGSTGWSTIATKTAGVTSHAITGLTDGTYYYRIYATSGGNNSGYVYANATIDTPLSAPSNFTAQASGTTVSFSWTDNNGGTAQTRIEASTTSGSTGFTTLTTVSAGVTTYQATSVAADDYWYRALAVDGGDTSPNTAAVAVTVSTGSGGGVGISSITGTPSDGATITVNGGSFGTMGGDALYFAYGDEFTSGAINNRNVTLGTTGTYVIGIGSDTTAAHLLYSTENPRTGRSASMRRRHFDGSGVYRAGGFGPSNVHESQLFFSFWRHATYPYTWVAASKNYKLYYVVSNGRHSSSGGNEVPQPILHVPANGNSIYMGANLSGSDPNVNNNQGWNAVNSFGTWQRYDNWVKMSADYGVQDGEIDVWRDGVLGITDHTFSWFGVRADWVTKPTHFEDVRLGYMDQGMNDFIVDISDLYVANTRARVVIGDASAWSLTTHTEIQLARNSNWSDSSISSVIFNYGSFTSGQTVYLYVIKSDGQPVSNSGYAVVLP